MIDIRNKKITVIGWQRSGVALAKLITQAGGCARISEKKKEADIDPGFVADIKAMNVVVETGGHTEKFIHESDMVVLSPGVHFNAPPVEWARKKEICILGEIEFAFQFCQCPVIAVTGSNGKTTVSTLIDLVLRDAGYRSALCGNVGNPFSNLALESSDKDYLVLEISSFQLESLLPKDSVFLHRYTAFKNFRPYIGVWLNFSQNHLDRHKDLDEYFWAKAKLFSNQTKNDFAVVNRRIPNIQKVLELTQSTPCFFGDDLSENPNHAAVRTVAGILGIQENISTQVFSHFKGVEHRLEWVRTLNGVDFINDSKATTAEAGAWALKQMHKPVVLLCGGRDKNIDFSVLTDLVKDHVKKMIIYGEAKEKLKRTFASVVTWEEAGDFVQAVHRAQQAAATGDCVLLSPMCASFDMFRDYEERGRIYKKIVQEL